MTARLDCRLTYSVYRSSDMVVQKSRSKGQRPLIRADGLDNLCETEHWLATDFKIGDNSPTVHLAWRRLWNELLRISNSGDDSKDRV